jgi:HEAT repeat protein
MALAMVAACVLTGCGEVGGYLEQLRSGTPEERVQAAAFLGAQRDVGAIPHLQFALRDTLPELRAKAAWALGYMGSRESMYDILPLLHDPHRRVRQQAAVALMHVEDPEAIPALEIAAAAEKDAWVKGDMQRAISYLQQFLGETDLGEATFR